MMKFFRKYMKHMLAVFMALLLIVWLGDRALTEMLGGPRDGGGERVGQVYGQTVYVRDLLPAQNNLQLLETLGLEWRYPWAYVAMDAGLIEQSQMAQYLIAQVRPTPLEVEEWYMLDLEAQRRGIRPSQEAFDRLKSQIPLQLIDHVRKSHRVSLAQIDHALRAFLRVTEAAASGIHTVKASEADVRHLIRQTRERAKAEFVLLNAEMYIEPTYQPTQEELEKQFEEYKNEPPGTGGMEFGYQLPEAVEIEYIRIDAVALQDRMRITDEEAFRYWEANKQEFLRPPVAPAVEDEPAPEPTPYETFSEARHLVRQKLQEQRARAETLRIARDLISRSNQAWAHLERAESETDGQAAAANTELYANLVDQFNERHGEALTYGHSDMMVQGELAGLPVGQVTALAGTQQQINLAQAAFLVMGLAEPDGWQDRFHRELYQTAPEPFLDRDGNAYVFRTVAFKPPRPPESMEGIQDQLVEDVRKQRAYAEAERQARELQEMAARVGLQEALAAQPELMEKLGEEPIRKPAAFARVQMISFGGMRPASIPGIGSDAALTERVFSLGEQSVGQTIPAVDVHEQREQQRWIVVQFAEMVPVTQQEYQQERDGAIRTLQAQAQFEVLADWFEPEQLRARVNWQEAPRPADPQDELEAV